MYKIVIRKQALKEMEGLPQKINQKISQAIDGLSSDPRPAGCKKIRGEVQSMWRIRVGNYRILYDIEDQVRIIDIRKVGHRKDVYK